MRNRSKWILITAVLVLAAMPALSQEGDVPTARQVVDRYIEAMGGEEAIRANNTMVMEGNMEWSARVCRRTSRSRPWPPTR